MSEYLLSLRYVIDDLRVAEIGEIDARALASAPRLTLGIMKLRQSGTLEQLLDPEAFANGQRSLLLTQRVHRFGALPESVVRRVGGANTRNSCAGSIACSMPPRSTRCSLRRALSDA